MILQGGAEVHTLSFLRILVQQGYKVAVCCYYKYNDAMVSQYESPGARVLLLKRRRSITTRATLFELISLMVQLHLLVPWLVEFRNSVHTNVVDLKRLRVRTIFLTQPLLFDSSNTWNSVVGWDYSVNGKKGKLSAATYAKLLGIFNEELIVSCHADSVEVFDLAAEIPHSSEVFYDAMHFNEKGANIVAEKISSYLQSHRDEESHH
jgi:hypothetical protein